MHKYDVEMEVARERRRLRGKGRPDDGKCRSYYEGIWGRHLRYLPEQMVNAEDALTLRAEMAIGELTEVASDYCVAVCERELWAAVVRDA